MDSNQDKSQEPLDEEEYGEPDEEALAILFEEAGLPSPKWQPWESAGRPRINRGPTNFDKYRDVIEE